MPLITEDGTARADAESYASIAFADAYHDAMGAASWANATLTARETALRKATAYVEAAYTWRGVRATVEQALSWPRGGVMVDGVGVEIDVVPIQLQRAVCELALKSLTVTLMPDVSPDVVTREKVGPVEAEYGQPRNGGLTRFALVDAMLRDLALTGGAGSSVRVTRA